MLAITKLYNECHIVYKGKKHNNLPSEILSQFNFIIGYYSRTKIERVLLRLHKSEWSMLYVCKTETTYAGVASS